MCIHDACKKYNNHMRLRKGYLTVDDNQRFIVYSKDTELETARKL